METSLITLVVKPGEADRLIAGHPWVYSSSIQRSSEPPTDGELVQLKDHRHRFLGVGFYNSRSKIQVRMLSTERVEVNCEFFVERIRAALAVRKRHMPDATSFRVVSAEADQLSGLIIDKYGDVVVLQISSLGMEKHKADIVKAIQKVLQPQSVYERNEIASRQFEGLPPLSGLLAGEPVETVDVTINGLKFSVDLRAGHKTGMYLDQQVNQARVGAIAKDAVVLDCFTFVGGFALHCARGGARQVIALDQSEDAFPPASMPSGTDSQATPSSRCATSSIGSRPKQPPAPMNDWCRCLTSSFSILRALPEIGPRCLTPCVDTRRSMCAR